MVFGFLPIGLAYHAAYSILRGAMMAILVVRVAQASWKSRNRLPNDSGHCHFGLPGADRLHRQRRLQEKQGEHRGFFLANRSIGPLVFFLSIFATNMTAFAILGSSGQAYRQGIGIYGMMASSSCFVIPLTIFFIGTRLWALGKKFGHQTQVSFFRDRWECNHIGTVIFALSAAMLVPYMIISIMGGGTVLADISTSAETHQPLIPYAWGCAWWPWW
jgi:Na+/pantothenate symporter